MDDGSAAVASTQPDPNSPSLEGLSEAEAAARRARGEGNDAAVPTSRSYAEIVRENVFSFITNCLFVLGLALVALGRPSDALVSVGVVLANALVGVVQEIRAKRTLDRIALLTLPTAVIVRDGREREVDPGEIVRGDVIAIGPGDQIAADGKLIGVGSVDVDESLLTGESHLLTKRAGDSVLSGSLCAAGRGFYVADSVGSRGLAYQLAAGARAFRREYTPLQREINLLIRIVLLVAGFLEILLIVDTAIAHRPFVDLVARSVVVIGLVPNGLVLAIAVAYGAGALRIVGRGILVQEANAVESLSQVDVLCLDKTGTLTTGRHRVEEMRPIGVSSPEIQDLLGDFAAAVTTPNRTIASIAHAYPRATRLIRTEVPFLSERRWSALSFADSIRPEVYVLGAPEIVDRHRLSDGGIGPDIAGWSERGLRVLLLARGNDPDVMYDERGTARLPVDLTPLGLIGLGDEIRSGARERLEQFAATGIGLKVISGDDPSTVSALARRVGLGSPATVASGADLPKTGESALERMSEETTIFGRVTPGQKWDVVEALRRRGHHVAMIGDGINDVLALKAANLGIALGSGSPATRAVADLVLIADSFENLPRAFREGQRIQNGMQNVLKLFLTRVLAVALLLIATGIVGEFPLGPKHNALLALFTVGIPSIALAVWARPGRVGQHRLLSLLHFVFPAALVLTLVALGVHLGFYLGAEREILAARPESALAYVDAVAIPIAQSALTSFAIFCGLLLLLFVAPPVEPLGDGSPVTPDRRPAILALILGAVYLLVLASPTLRQFFDLTPLSIAAYLLLGALAILWGLVLRWTWRSWILERFLGIAPGIRPAPK